MKIVDTKTLKKMLLRARTLQYSRLMPKKSEKQLDPNGRHILTDALIHGDVQCMRCLVMAKMTGLDNPVQGLLDFQIDDFNRLPDHNG